jgi:alpha-tubulin suppressor-like RCC1 family protein
VHSPRPVGLIAAGAFSVFAVGRDAKAWAWGDNSFGQLGTGSAQVGSTAPHEVARIENVAAVAAGSADGYALLSDRTVWAWGDNSLGQLGGGACRLTAAGPRSTCLGSAVPDEVPGLRGVVAIAAGGDSGYALRRDGSVWAWGDDGYGELGNALVRLDEDVPVRVVGLTHVIAIAAGSCSGYALLTNGTVWSWGRGDYGQLGDGATSDRSVPVQVKDLTNVVQVVGGGDMAFALLSNGELWAWGANAYGQLGDGSVTDHDLPVRVLGLPGPPP